MSHIILIGMPGSGKTTMGKKLAKLLDLKFVDTDDLLEARMGMTLAEFRASHSDKEFAEMEEKLGLDLVDGSMVIATGGSFALSRKAMEHVMSKGVVVHIDVPVRTLEKRLGPARLDRVTNLPPDGLKGLWRDRKEFYTQQCHLTLYTRGRSNSSRQSRELADLIYDYYQKKQD